MLRKFRKLREIDYKNPKFLILTGVWLIGTITLGFVFNHYELQATDMSRMSESEVDMTTTLRGGKPSYSGGRVAFYTAFSSFALAVILNVFHKMTTRSKYDQDY